MSNCKLNTSTWSYRHFLDICKIGLLSRHESLVPPREKHFSTHCSLTILKPSYVTTWKYTQSLIYFYFLHFTVIWTTTAYCSDFCHLSHKSSWLYACSLLVFPQYSGQSGLIKIQRSYHSHAPYLEESLITQSKS